MAWRNWIRADAPIANARERRHTAPTYAVEVELDHAISQIDALGTAAIAGRSLCWRELVNEELANLDRIRTTLTQCSISESSRVRFEEFILLTRRVLNELAEIDAD